MPGRWRSEDGVVTVFVVGLTLSLMLLAGLVYDGGRILAARQRAHDLADNAARAAAQEIDLDSLRSGAPPAIDPIAGEIAARDFLAETGNEGSVVVTGDHVTVSVSITTPMALLQLAGISERTVTGTGEARIVRGVTGPEG